MKKSGLFLIFIVLTTILTLSFIRSCTTADSGFIGFVKNRYLNRAVLQDQSLNDKESRTAFVDSIVALRIQDSIFNEVRLNAQIREEMKDSLRTISSQKSFTPAEYSEKIKEMIQNLE
jgi:hypothetical protein